MSIIRRRYFGRIAMKFSEQTAVNASEFSIPNEIILNYSMLLNVTEEDAELFLKEWIANEQQLGLRFKPLLEQAKSSRQKLDEIYSLSNLPDENQDAVGEKCCYSLHDANGFVRFILDGDNNFAEKPDFQKLERAFHEGMTALEDSRNDILMELSFLKQLSDVPKQYDNVMSQSEIILKGIKKIFIQQRIFRRQYELYVEKFRNAVMESSFVKDCNRAEQERNINNRSIILFYLFILGIDDFSTLDQWKTFAVNNKLPTNSMFCLLATYLKLLKFLFNYVLGPLCCEFMSILLRLTASSEISVEMQGKLREHMCRARNMVKYFPKYINVFDECLKSFSDMSDCLSEVIREFFRIHTIIKFWVLYQFKKKKGNCSADLKFLDVVKTMKTDQKFYGQVFDHAICHSFDKEILDWFGDAWQKRHAEIQQSVDRALSV